MKLNLYERLQGEEFATPQALLIRAQRLELDNAVLEARKHESSIATPAISSISASSSNRFPRSDQSSYYQPHSTSTYTSSYPPPLMSTSYSFPFAPSYNTTSNLRSSFPSESSPYPYASSPVTHTSTRPRRSIVCYSCGQPGHISPYCPARPKDER
ncbi:unnamed protein product, partial [Rotaria sordida]